MKANRLALYINAGLPYLRIITGSFIFAFLLAETVGHAMPKRKVTDLGLKRTESIILEQMKGRYLRKARKLYRNIREIEERDLEAIRSSKRLVSFVGFSSDKKLNAAVDAAGETTLDIDINLISILSKLDPKKVAIISGGTEGGIVGRIQKLAMNMGFQVIAVTAGAAAEYDVAPSHQVYFGGSKFGSESDILVQFSDEMISIGGGDQALAELAQFQSRLYSEGKNPGDHIHTMVGSSYSGAIVNGDIMKTVHSSADQLASAILKNYSEHIAYRSFRKQIGDKGAHFWEGTEQMTSLLAITDRKLVFATGWTRDDKSELKVNRQNTETFIANALSALDPKKTIIMVNYSTDVTYPDGTSKPTSDGMIAKIAKEKGFKVVIGFARDNFKSIQKNPDFVFEQVIERDDILVELGNDWVGQNRLSIELANAVILTGGGQSIFTMAKLAKAQGKPLLIQSGVSAIVDLSAAKEGYAVSLVSDPANSDAIAGFSDALK